MYQSLNQSGPVQGLKQGVGDIADVLGDFFQRKRESTSLGEAGYNVPTNVKNPKLREALLDQQQKSQLSAQQGQLEEKDIDTIRDAFGDTFANVYKASPVGGRTALLQQAIQQGLRKEDIEDLFNVKKEQKEGTATEQQPGLPQVKNGKLPSDLNLPDFSRRPPGYSQKEWADEKKEWRKTNTPLFEEVRKRRNSTKKDLLSTKHLQKLNATGKIAQGFERTLVNPNTGEFYGLAQLTGKVGPETQQWVKEIARFGNRAKDAFGSRVTNFDLSQYMKQFPGLLNTQEGRDRILKMMEINYHLDDLYDQATQAIYDKKGLSNIPPEEVDRFAREMIGDETKRLENEYLQLDQENESSTHQSQNPPQGTVLMLDPKGNPLYVPPQDVDKLISLGAKLSG